MSWFFVYVWPAIALQRDQGLSGTLLAGIRAVDRLSPSKAADLVPKEIVPALHRLLKAGDLPARHGLSSPAGPSHGRSSVPAAAVSTPLTIFLYTAMSILLALLGFTVWAEYSSATRQPFRWGP